MGAQVCPSRKSVRPISFIAGTPEIIRYTLMTSTKPTATMPHSRKMVCISHSRASLAPRRPGSALFALWPGLAAAGPELFNAFSMGSSFSRQQNHKVSGTDPAPERQEARTAWVNRLVIPPQEPRRRCGSAHWRPWRWRSQRRPVQPWTGTHPTW